MSIRDELDDIDLDNFSEWALAGYRGWDGEPAVAMKLTDEPEERLDPERALVVASMLRSLARTIEEQSMVVMEDK